MLKINRNKQTVTAKIIDNETGKATRKVEITFNCEKYAKETAEHLRQLHKVHEKTQWEVMEIAMHEYHEGQVTKDGNI